jgi:hypothetical protein
MSLLGYEIVSAEIGSDIANSPWVGGVVYAPEGKVVTGGGFHFRVVNGTSLNADVERVYRNRPSASGNQWIVSVKLDPDAEDGVLVIWAVCVDA